MTANDEHRHGHDAQHGNDHKHSDSHQHGNGHQHGHGHHNDQGISAMLRYLRFAPSMWRSEVNRAVLAEIDPKPGERVLDIGAGMGPAAVAAAKAGATVLAIEPTPFMRRILTARRLVNPARSRIVIIDGAAEKLPAGAGTIDAVWAVNTMHHWIDPSLAAPEIARVLRPGGRVLLVDEDFNDPTHPDHDRFEAMADHHDGDGTDDRDHHGFTLVDADEMGALLEKAGLIEVVAGKRQLAGAPVIAVSALAPDQPPP